MKVIVFHSFINIVMIGNHMHLCQMFLKFMVKLSNEYSLLARCQEVLAVISLALKYFRRNVFSKYIKNRICCLF